MGNWEDNVRKVIPYVPGEQPKEADIVKLNTNENPYPASLKAEEALKNLSADRLRRYPDPTASLLVESIAGTYQVAANQVFVGVGSDDVLAMIFLTFFSSGKKILFPDITYSFYDVWADLFRIPYQTIPLNDRLAICGEDYYQENQPNGGVIFPNPNAPTGVELGQNAIEEIIRHNPDSVVVVDEAYVDFGAESALPLIDRYDNVLVVQTFSKSRAMAGMRIGYCFGSEKLIRYLNDVKYSFNSYTMDAATLVTGKAVMEDTEYFKEITGKVIATREWAKKEFTRLGFFFEDSKSNFVFVTHRTVPAGELFEALRKAHIFVRYFKKPRIDNYLRVTIGTDEEMKRLFAFLETYIKEYEKQH